MAKKKNQKGEKPEPLITRKDIAEYMEGTPTEDEYYPGKGMGLPATGPTSIATLGRRVGALFIDWIIASALSWLTTDFNSWMTLVYFVVIHWLLIGLIGATIGKAMFRIQVVRVGGARVGVWRGLIRAVLLGLVIPAVIMDRDQRGLHERLSGTVEISA